MAYSSVGDIGLDVVFERFQLPTILPLSLREITINKLLWDSVMFHLEEMTHLSELGFQNHGFNTSVFSAVQDPKAYNPIWSFDAENRAQASHMKVLQFDMHSLQVSHP